MTQEPEENLDDLQEQKTVEEIAVEEENADLDGEITLDESVVAEEELHAQRKRMFYEDEQITFDDIKQH
ncbi:MAG: hypothetical protein J6Q65_01230, partial [Lentisphaeria bacterium]|nr:hypothetical protein [Lentisphaeria bacterium]